ncbi:IS3 family transposase [bacterium]|nr:IS3 family transposase [bacterium]
MPNQSDSGGVRRKYEYIESNQGEYKIRMMCRLLGVSPSGYYQWRKKPISDRAREDSRLVRLIRASFLDSQCVYGAPRVFLDLREAGETCSKHRVARLMRENNIRVLPGYRTRRYIARKPAELIPNLVRRRGSHKQLSHIHHLCKRESSVCLRCVPPVTRRMAWGILHQCLLRVPQLP